MKKILSLLISAMMLILLVLPASAADAAYTFTVKVDDSTVETGDKIKVSLEVKKNDGTPLSVYTMQDYVSFDSEMFKVVEGSLEFDSSKGYMATVQDGCIYINRYSSSAAEYSGSSSTVLTFELEAVNPGTAELGHSVGEMVGPKLVFYSVDLKEANVTVEEDSGYQPPAEPDDTNKRYDIDVPTKIKNGDIAVSHKTAKKGTTVKIIVDPDSGYELDELTVKRSNGRKVSLTKRTEDTYSFVMPDSDVEISVSFVKVATTPVTPVTPPVTPETPETPTHVCPSEKYKDVDQKQWYHEAIDYAVTNGLMNGMSDSEFAPNVTTSRAMIATILWRQQGQPTVDYVMPFNDVAGDQWYAEAVRWAAYNGIVTGYGDGTFGPNDTITREQFATMLYRYEKIYGNSNPDITGFVLNFTDANKVSDWAKDAMMWCNKNGIINGMGEGILLPQGNATRAQAAQILMNYNTK